MQCFFSPPLTPTQRSFWAVGHLSYAWGRLVSACLILSQYPYHSSLISITHCKFSQPQCVLSPLRNNLKLALLKVYRLLKSSGYVFDEFTELLSVILSITIINENTGALFMKTLSTLPTLTLPSVNNLPNNINYKI